MIMKATTALFLAALIPLMTACGAAETQSSPKPACKVTHQLSVEATKQTEAGGRFDAALERAGRDGQPATMIDITRSAGWADDWDRMIEVRSGSTDEQINQRAHTVDHCWEGIGRSNASEGPPAGYYVFTKENGSAGADFVRVVRWYGDKLQLKMTGREALAPDSVMSRSGNGYLLPAP